MQHYEFLIVGQGLAGTLLAYQLLKQNKSFLVINDNTNLSSSRVAAGMFNPVGGKRMLKTWLAELLLEYVDTTYNELEKLLDSKFYYPQTIIHAFQNDDEKSKAEKSLVENDISKYIENNNQNFSGLNINHGSLKINNGGWLDTENFLVSFESYLKNNQKVLFEKIDYQLLNHQDNKWLYKNVSFDNIVFCEGYQSINNPFFSWLPFQLSKGEVVTIKAQNLPQDYILKKGIYLVPLDNSHYKVGASYEWQDLSLNPTDKAKSFLENKLSDFLTDDYLITKHFAGIRPTVIDKKPLLGQHPINKNMYIFNGLGTKGVMIAPYFSEILVNHIISSQILPSEVDIKRFIKN